MMKSSRRSTRAVAAQERDGNLAALNLGAFPAAASHRRAESVRGGNRAQAAEITRLVEISPAAVSQKREGIELRFRKKIIAGFDCSRTFYAAPAVDAPNDKEIPPQSG